MGQGVRPDLSARLTDGYPHYFPAFPSFRPDLHALVALITGSAIR